MVRQRRGMRDRLVVMLVAALPVSALASDGVYCLAGCGETSSAPARCEAGCLGEPPLVIQLKDTNIDDGSAAPLLSVSAETVTETKADDAPAPRAAPAAPKAHPKAAHDEAPGAALHGNLSPLRY